MSILGLQRSRAIPTDYQLVPLLLSMGQERTRLLIADDVGTGKTIEAGLVLSELLARGMARRVLVVVPANLRDQWSEALRDTPGMHAARGRERAAAPGTQC